MTEPIPKMEPKTQTDPFQVCDMDGWMDENGVRVCHAPVTTRYRPHEGLSGIPVPWGFRCVVHAEWLSAKHCTIEPL